MGSSPKVNKPSTATRRKRQRAPFERRVTRLSILLVAPALLVSGIVIWLQPWSLQSKLMILGAESFACLLIGAALALHDHIVRPLQTLANVVGALREERRCPLPLYKSVRSHQFAKRVAALETRAPVAVIPEPEIDFLADPDQLERMLINLVRNAADAVLQIQEAENHSNGSKHSDTQQQIVFSWKTTAEDVIISIQDNGPGLMNPGNAFVPFYTTKPTGSGIGLVLSRQIAEAHGGSLELSNRTDQVWLE